jgi:uncharacterized membrane protein
MADQQPANPAPQPAAPSGGSDVDQNKLMAVLAYLGILVVVPIVAAKDSAFAKYHANQGLALLIADIAAWVALMVIGFIVPFLFLVSWVVWIGLLVLHIMGIINAANGEMKPLPVIGGMKLLK